jgi:hypothetical protein
MAASPRWWGSRARRDLHCLGQPALPPFAGPDSIAAGPDRALWFTESLANTIGRISVSAAVPTSDDHCEHGGWRDLVDNHGHRFRDDRRCVRLVERDGCEDP